VIIFVVPLSAPALWAGAATVDVSGVNVLQALSFMLLCLTQPCRNWLASEGGVSVDICIG
jgi:hypothetical protein